MNSQKKILLTLGLVFLLIAWKKRRAIVALIGGGEAMPGLYLNPLQIRVVEDITGQSVPLGQQPSEDLIIKFQQIVAGKFPELGVIPDGRPGIITQTAIQRLKPELFPLPSKENVDRVYGKFSYHSLANGHIQQDSKYAEEHIVRVTLFDKKQIRINKALAYEFPIVYKLACDASGYFPSRIDTFVPRHIGRKVSNPLSNHSWGVAFDFDPPINPYGGVRANGQPSFFRTPAGKKFVDVFRQWGYSCGVDWKIKDDMHIERVHR